VKERKLCPLPVPTFTGRQDILEKMCRYFDSDSEFQRVFVLYGLGGSGKSQIAFKFLQKSQDNKRYELYEYDNDFLMTFILFLKNSFSDIFYIDAINEQTLEMDLIAVTPANVEPTVDASLRWLTNQREGRRLLFFDNADDVHLQLKKFIPPCASGNILVTTRNPELRLSAAKGSDENVRGMDHEDAKRLLLHLSKAEETKENEVLAAQIVQVLSVILFYV
jgi:hypothetical protein